MPRVTILTEKDLRACIALDLAAVTVIEQAFAALARGGVVMPPILSMAIAERHGEVDVKTAYVPGLECFAIKVSPGFFDNPRRGLPSLNGLMMLFDAETGIVRAVLLDNGFLTAIRTAAAGAVAAKYLAKPRIATVAALGAGEQAALQVAALRLVRDFSTLVVWARDHAKASAHAERMRERLGVAVRVANSPEEAVRSAELIVTATPSRTALVRREWLSAGQHVTAMGSDAPDKQELDPAIVASAGRFVCDRVSQSRLLGEMRAAIAAGLLAPDHRADELGEIVAGLKPGRRSDDEITVCDLTGTGVQDTAVATHAWRIAVARGLGQTIES
jgi:ornithine cyclodeaminase